MYPLLQNQHLAGHPAMMLGHLAGMWCLRQKEMQDKRSNCSGEALEKVSMSSGREMRKRISACGEGRETVTIAMELSQHSISISKNERALMRIRYY